MLFLRTIPDSIRKADLIERVTYCENYNNFFMVSIVFKVGSRILSTANYKHNRFSEQQKNKEGIEIIYLIPETKH